MANLTKVKEVANAVLMKDASGQRFIRLDNVIFSYPYLGTQSEDENDNGAMVKKWRTAVLLPKDTHEEAKGLVEQVIKKLIAENEAKVPADKWFITDGDDKDDPHSQNHWIVSASDGKIRPTARNAKGIVIDSIDKIDETFYGGAIGSILIRPWFFSGKAKNSAKTYPKRVSAGVTAVMFTKDGTPFGAGRIDDESAWDGVADTSGAGDGDGMDDDDL